MVQHKNSLQNIAIEKGVEHTRLWNSKAAINELDKFKNEIDKANDEYRKALYKYWASEEYNPQ